MDNLIVLATFNAHSTFYFFFLFLLNLFIYLSYEHDEHD